MAVAGVFALHYWPKARETAESWWEESQMLFRRENLETIRRAQAELQHGLSELAKEYAVVHPRGMG